MCTLTKTKVRQLSLPHGVHQKLIKTNKKLKQNIMKKYQKGKKKSVTRAAWGIPSAVWSPHLQNLNSSPYLTRCPTLSSSSSCSCAAVCAPCAALGVSVSSHLRATSPDVAVAQHSTRLLTDHEKLLEVTNIWNNLLFST